jgi:hypothetical protein
MPIYTFENTETGTVEEIMMSISARDEYVKDNPHMKQLITGAPGLVSGTGLQGKMDNGWKENLARIAEAHPTSALAERQGGRSSKTVKTQEAIKKHTGNAVLKKGTNYGLDNS